MILTHNNYKAILPARYWDKFLQLKSSPESRRKHVVYNTKGKVTFSNKKLLQAHEKESAN